MKTQMFSFCLNTFSCQFNFIFILEFPLLLNYILLYCVWISGGKSTENIYSSKSIVLSLKYYSITSKTTGIKYYQYSSKPYSEY